MIAFAFYTGCRKGEIAALRWSDLDWNGGRVLVERSWKRTARKSGESVTVNLNPHLRAILQAHQKRTRGEGEALVFPDPETGKMRRKHNGGKEPRNLWGIDAVIAGAKVRRFRYPWHSFRHSHGTALALAGANLNAIQAALGQSTLEMASRYTHAAAEIARQHVAKLPALGPTEPSTVTSIHSARAKVDTDGYGTKSRRTKAS